MTKIRGITDKEAESHFYKFPNDSDADSYLYHATMRHNLEGIIHSGFKLLPSKEDQTNWGGSLGYTSVGKVFLARTPDHAEYYGRIIQRNADAWSEFLVVVRIPKRDVGNTRLDPEDFESVVTTSPVPLRNADVFTGDEWRPFTEDLAWNISEGEWDEVSYEDEEEDEEVYESTPLGRLFVLTQEFAG